jgi:hypothetical protein
MRAAKVMLVFEGTSHIQSLAIGRRPQRSRLPVPTELRSPAIALPV